MLRLGHADGGQALSDPEHGTRADTGCLGQAFLELLWLEREASSSASTVPVALSWRSC